MYISEDFQLNQFVHQDLLLFKYSIQHFEQILNKCVVRLFFSIALPYLQVMNKKKQNSGM